MAAQRYEELVTEMDDEETAQQELERLRQDALTTASETPNNIEMIDHILEHFAHVPWTLFYPPDQTLRYILDNEDMQSMDLLKEQFSAEPEFWTEEVESALKSRPESAFIRRLRGRLVYFPEED